MVRHRTLLILLILSLVAGSTASCGDRPETEERAATSTSPTPEAAKTPPPPPSATPTRIPNTPTAESARGPESGSILFLTDRDGNPEIYRMQADGSGQTRLTNTDAYEGAPSAAPDGSRFAFSANLDGDEDIYSMSLDGTGLIRLTHTSGMDFQPDWSRDGANIIFTSQRDPVPGYEGPPPEIYRMAADGSSPTRLTHDNISDNCPSWSPDGSQIAFSSFHFEYASSRIRVMNRDGSQARVLVDTPGDDACPVWSPDGEWIAFASISSGRPAIDEIYLVRPDGTELTYVDGGGRARGMTWSPDGRWLAYSLAVGEDQDIYILRLGETEPVNITAGSSANEWAPDWVP